MDALHGWLTGKRADAMAHTLAHSGTIPPRASREWVGGGVAHATATTIAGHRVIVKDDGGHTLEVTAYTLARLFGDMVYVPPTVLRTDDGGVEVSCQRWQDDAILGDNYRIVDRSLSRVVRSDIIGAATFDYITTNSDRHDANWLVTRDDAGRNRIVLIDHGYTLDRSDHVASRFIALVRNTTIPAYIHRHLARTLPLVRQNDDMPLHNVMEVTDRMEFLLGRNRFPLF